jgi:signal transduction histidine kinase
MAENDREDRILTVATTTQDGFACVAVTDNGVGIDDTDINRIFNHGFSTKVNGHGFGLHTSANFMTEMGGRLSVTSAGVGQGATFTLWIPDNDRQNREAERATE